MEPGSIADWVLAGLTLLAVVVALFQREIVRWWRRPSVSLDVRLRAPD